VHGIVEVFIKLNNDGAITKAKVTKSLCAECDAEAVRLVKQGPKWKIKNRGDNKARVKVKF
jgi:outer membrane biosynthesis protein TonB